MMTTRSDRFRSLDRRHRRVRKKVSGSSDRPRLAVYRSNKHIYAQLIDDVAGRTLVASSTTTSGDEGAPKERAKSVGLDLATKAKAAGVTKVTFDRGGFKYHGRIQAVAEGAREGGLEF
jgi:large subunit ribosomal protein L18